MCRFTRFKSIYKVKSISTSLTSDSLLNCCLLDETQNSNEALLSVIWSIFPKHKSIIDSVVDLAVMRFNIWSLRLQYKYMDLVFSRVIQVEARKRDVKRSIILKDTRVSHESRRSRKVRSLDYGSGKYIIIYLFTIINIYICMLYLCMYIFIQIKVLYFI